MLNQSSRSVRRIGLAFRWLVLFVRRLEMGDCPLCNSVSMTLASKHLNRCIVCVCRRCTGNVITCLDISKQTRLSLSILVGLSIIIDPTLNQCVMFPLNRFLIICHDKLLIVRELSLTLIAIYLTDIFIISLGTVIFYVFLHLKSLPTS